VHLTAKVFEMLANLLDRPGQVFSLTVLLVNVWVG
jgi:DNA-binding response OmpR family regulator